MRFALFFLFFCAFVLPTDFVSITFAMSQADSTKRADTHLSFGVRYLKIKRYKDAQVQLLKSWSYRPKSRVYDDKRAPTNARYLGELFKKIEDYESAIMWYEKALEIDPKGNYKYANLLHKNLIFLYSEKNQYEKALSHAKKWFELEPNNAEVIKLVEQLRLLVRDDEPLPEMEIILNKNDDNYIELAEKLEKEAILQESYGNHRLSFD